MGKPRRIDSFFKIKEHPVPLAEKSQIVDDPVIDSEVSSQPKTLKGARTEELGRNSIYYDPATRAQIWKYPVNERDEVIWAYITHGPCQPELKYNFPFSGPIEHPRRCQHHYFTTFPWLEYSKSIDKFFCHLCYVFNSPKNPSTFTIDGFQDWKIVGGKNYALLRHMGDVNLIHDKDVQCKLDLVNQPHHIPQSFGKQSAQQREDNRLRLKVSIDATNYLSLRSLAFRGHDEKEESLNRRIFLELVDLLASFDKKVEDVMKHRYGNVSYNSGQILKEIIQIIARKVMQIVRDEIVHVKNTSSITLKNKILLVLSRNNLDVRKIRGQGYDGANNMRGHFNGLQSLIAKESPYAYYVHCLAHHLQLTLVPAASEVVCVENFFEKLRYIINSATGSTKRSDELLDAQAEEIAQMIENDELETGRGLNQVCKLQRAGDTRWGSYLRSVSRLIEKFKSTRRVLGVIIDEGKTTSQCGQAFLSHETMSSFDFVFILHFIKELMEITDFLAQALQKKSQDIANAMYLVWTTKTLIQKLRDDGWDDLLLKILQELNSHFNEKSMDLISLNCALDPKDKYSSFDVEKILELAKRYHSGDFTEQEVEQLLPIELRHFGVEVSNNDDLNSLPSITKLCQWMVKTGR
ncbi:hypothetical protein LIER_05903 [Lithospermum erythrorhizon]|uniref:TTF-type domain-containing protein n=1 Tax=Lithospermum erythrorhizon TaxID=34254 RepID=A0AAV3P2J0_LITER